MLKTIFLFFLISVSLYAEQKNWIFSIGLGKGLIQNDLNDSKNTAYNNSLLYLSTEDSKINRIYTDQFFQNNQNLQKENSSIRESFAFHYSLEKFIFRNFSIGFQANLNSVNIQNYDPSHLGSGGYSLLLFKTYFGNNFTAPLRTYNLRRSINNYSLVFGHTFEYGKFLFYPRVMYGGGDMNYRGKTLDFNHTQIYSAGANISFSYQIADYENDEKIKVKNYIGLDFTAYRYFIPGDYMNKFIDRLESRGFLYINEVNVSISFRRMTFE